MPAWIVTVCASGRSCAGRTWGCHSRPAKPRTRRRSSGWCGRSSERTVRCLVDTRAVGGWAQTHVVRRVATVVLVGVALAVGGGAYAWSELVPGPPTTIAIVPGNEVVLVPTAQFQFASDVRDARNRAVGMKPAWTSEASIDERGLFTAPDRAGVYFVRAALGELAATAKITVTPGTPRTVRVLPASASLKPRDTVAFSATAFDEWGNSVPVTPTWRVTAGSGTIDDQGIFMAGAAGVSTITMDVEGITTSATATAHCVPP